MTTTPTLPSTDVERSLRLYRALLIAYPRKFREEYGDDLVQGYRDLLVFGAARRPGWWATARDVISSATRERGAALSSGGRPPWVALLAIIAVAVVIVGAGGVLFPVIAIPAIVLVGLPIVGLAQFRRAWVVRRTTGGAVTRHVFLGLASFLPAVASLAWFGEDAGYFVFLAIAVSVIAASALGIVWAGVALVQRRGDPGPGRWKRPLLILVPSVVVLAAIIGGSYNSYRNSLGPPGDHSVENASADTEALWVAAGRGDLAEVNALIDGSCADPWVKFPVGSGRHNAKGYAEGRGLQGAPGPYGEIADALGDYMDTWYDDCGGSSD